MRARAWFTKRSYGITAKVEATDADGDKATDSASAGDLTPSVDVTIDSFEVDNNGDVGCEWHPDRHGCSRC
ncbi:MAG: hypothetical protein R3E57_03665 [Porticoccaceae bacterium]